MNDNEEYFLADVKISLLDATTIKVCVMINGKEFEIDTYSFQQSSAITIKNLAHVTVTDLNFNLKKS